MTAGAHTKAPAVLAHSLLALPHANRGLTNQRRWLLPMSNLSGTNNHTQGRSTSFTTIIPRQPAARFNGPAEKGSYTSV